MHAFIDRFIPCFLNSSFPYKRTKLKIIFWWSWSIGSTFSLRWLIIFSGLLLHQARGCEIRCRKINSHTMSWSSHWDKSMTLWELSALMNLGLLYAYYKLWFLKSCLQNFSKVIFNYNSGSSFPKTKRVRITYLLWMRRLNSLLNFPIWFSFLPLILPSIYILYFSPTNQLVDGGNSSTPWVWK